MLSKIKLHFANAVQGRSPAVQFVSQHLDLGTIQYGIVELMA